MDVLIIDDEKSIRRSTSMALEADGHYSEGVENSELAFIRLREDPFDLVLLDLRLGDEDGLEVLQTIKKKKPELLVAIFTAHGSIQTAVEALKLGAFDFLEKPFTPDQLRALLARAKREEKNQVKISNLTTKVNELKAAANASSPPYSFESAEPAMQATFETLKRAAPTPATIMILGESGTGKSVIAKNIHDGSHLAEKPFVTVSCPSLSKELLESELFGHIRGSFTGAVKDKWGKVHAADGGTLFLDEIGELPLDIQPKLLRLLQEREYERLGESTTRTANLRIIVATNRNLMQCVEEGTFREDLYYRLNVIAVEMPSLRDRQADLLEFAETYMQHFAKTSGRKIEGFSSGALARLTSHPWPGNLRELRNAIERAVILSQGPKIEAEDLPVPQALANVDSKEQVILPGAHTSLEELEEEHIKRVVNSAGSLSEAADILGIDKATLYRKRKKMELS